MLFLVETIVSTIVLLYDVPYDWQYLTVYCLPNWPDFLEINLCLCLL